MIIFISVNGRGLNYASGICAKDTATKNITTD